MIHHSLPTLPKNHLIDVQKLLKSGMIANGVKCFEFKKMISNYFNSNDVLLTNSGTSAIFVALKILKTSKKEVILPTYVCKDVFEAVQIAGYTPILCDLEENWNVGYNSVKLKVTKNTAAIIVTHSLGICANVLELKKLGIPIIEDCCQSLGSRYQNKLCGTIGDITVLSFNATKCLTSAEGGSVVINSANLVRKSDFNLVYEHAFRMSDLQAVIGIQQFNDYENFLEKRRKIASFYFKNIDFTLTEKFSSSKSQSNYFRFLLFNSTKFEKIKTELQKKNIAVRKGIDSLLHRSYKTSTDKEFPNSTHYFNNTISIPIYPSLNLTDARLVSNSINNYFDGSFN
jgi:perosamine synthetase